jgi:hypothetical protein
LEWLESWIIVKSSGFNIFNDTMKQNDVIQMKNNRNIKEMNINNNIRSSGIQTCTSYIVLLNMLLVLPTCYFSYSTNNMQKCKSSHFILLHKIFLHNHHNCFHRIKNCVIFCKYKQSHEKTLYLSHYEKLSLREPHCLATKCQLDV